MAALPTKKSFTAIARQKDNALAKVRALQKEQEASLSPVEMTTYVMAGAALAGLARRYAPEQAQQLRTMGGLALGAYGSTQNQPQMVAIALGMTASMVEQQVYGALSRPAASAAPPAPAQLPGAAADPHYAQPAPAPAVAAGG